MFYLVSQRMEQKGDLVELPTLDSSAKLALAEVSVRKVGQEWLLLSPATGAWCFVTDTEMGICRRLINISFDELQRQVAWPAESLRSLLRHLYVRGLLTVYKNGMIYQGKWNVDPLSVSRTFILIFLLSSRCNLACKYCYLGLAAERGEDPHLSKEVALRVLEYAFQQSRESLSIDFGEIAVSHALFRDLVQDIQHLQDIYSKKASLAIQTNGTTLNPHSIDFLKRNNISVGISLDGPAYLNDQVRIFPNGAGSYERAVRGLKEVLRQGIPHVVTCTVSRLNCTHASEILDHFLDLGIIHYYFKPIIQRGTARTMWAQLGIEAEDYCCFLDDVVDYVAVSGNPDVLDEGLLRCLFRALGDERGWRSRCSSGYCNCGQDILVVSAQGELYPCPRFVCDDHKLFYLGKGTIEPLGRRFLSKLTVRLCSPPEVCQSCPWRFLCHGGCALSAWYYSGDSSALDPECPIHQHKYALVFERLIPMLRKRAGHISSKLGSIEVVDELLM